MSARTNETLLLVPVEIKKERFETTTDTFRYTIACTQEDIEINLSLAEKFRVFKYELMLFAG